MGITVTDFIAGYGFHSYPELDTRGIGGSLCFNSYNEYLDTADPCFLNNFSITLKATSDWLTQTDPGKQLWLTEFNWIPGKSPTDTYTIQVRRMGQMCDELPKWPAVSRYSWFYAAHDNSDYGVLSLFQRPYTGALSPSGTRYITC